jgi:hypothetical protein
MSDGREDATGREEDGLPRAAATAAYRELEYAETEDRSWPADVRGRDAWMSTDGKMPFAKYYDHPALPYYRDPECERTTSDPRRSWSDPSNWRDFETADRWVQVDPEADSEAALVGRAFIMQRKGDPYRERGEADAFLFADGDNVRDPETGAVIPEFPAAIERMTGGEPTFQEISSSDGGAHGLANGRLPDGTRTKYIKLRDEPVFGHDEPPMLELYEGPKVAVLSGRRVTGTPEEIAPVDPDGLAELLEEGTDAHPNVLAAAAKRSSTSGESESEASQDGATPSIEATGSASELPDEAPADLPRCYERALRARAGDPEAVEGVRMNAHGVNLIASNLAVHAGFDVESAVEHFATFAPAGGSFKRSITRKSLDDTETKAGKGDLHPPTLETLREVGLFAEGEECDPDCPIHSDKEAEGEDDEEPLKADVTLEPAIAWRAVGAVTPADLDPDPDDEYERELELEVNSDGEQWVCPHCEDAIGLLRAVGLEEGLITECDEVIDDRLYDEAYRRARRTYAAPLPEYVTEETATERWDVIQGALEQLTHWHLDSIESTVTGQGDDNDVVAKIDPCWEDSASGQRVIAFRSGACYCREHECVLDPVRLVALEEGIIEACDDELSGELFREAYVATRERGAPLPRWTVGNPDHHPVLPPADELVDEFETDVNALDSARGEVEDLYQQAATDASAAHLLRALPSLGKTTSAVKTAADEPTLYLGPRKELQKEVEEKAVEYGVSWMHLPVLSENSPEDDVVPAAVNVVREEGKELLRDSEDLLDRVTPDEDGDEDGNEEDGSDEPEDKAEPTEAVPTLEDAHDAGYGSLAEARQAEREVVGGGSSGGQTTDESEDEEIVLDRASCPCANGAHGEALQLAIHVARELGHLPRDIHVADKQLFGVELPCQHGGECAYSAAWTTATNPEAPIDLLIGSYGHAHVGGARTHYSTNDFDSTVLEPRTVVFDEFPGEAFAESFGEEALDHATWLASELVAQVDDRQDMIETDLWTNTWVRAWLRGEGENTITGQFHHNRLEYAVACRRVLDAADNCQHEADELLAGLDTDAPGQWKPDDLSDCLETCPAAQSNTPLEELREALTDAITALGDLAPLVGTTALLDAAGLDDAQDDEEAALGSLIDRAVEANIEGHDDASGLLDAARKTVRGGEEGCQALSVHARDPYAHPRSYLLLYGAIVKGSSDTSQIRTPSFGFDTRQAGANLKRGELDQATVLFDRNHHGAYVHDPPEFRDRAGSANPVVGLDATGRSELWSLAIGRGVEQTDIHDTDAERRAFLKDVLNVQVVQTAPHTKFYEGSTRSKNFDADIALIRAAGEEFGKQRIRADRITSTGKPGVITTKCVRNQLEEPLADDVEAMDNYGNVTGSNALTACRLGAVLGTQHYGDHTVEKWAALAGESVARTGHGTDLDYGSEIANTYLKHMSEDQTMQAILRFGRDEGGAVVFAHTAALRDEVPVVADGAVTTAFSRSAREVRDAALPYVGREEAFTVSDIEDDVECSRRSIQRALAEFAGLGYLERHEAGAGQANEFHPIADPGVGDVTLPTIDQPAEEPVDRSERRTSPDDDHSEVYYTWSVGVGPRNGGGSRRPPTSTAVLPAPTATSGGDPSASHGT